MSSAGAPDPKDPRFRAFRGGAWAVYLVVAVGFSLLVTYSVTRSVWLMTPGRPAATARLELDACRELAHGLAAQLEARRKGLSELDGGFAAFNRQWADFRLQWLNELRQTEAQCDVDDPARRSLRLAFARLEQVADAYAIHATQFAGQVHPAVRAFERALDGAEP